MAKGGWYDVKTEAAEQGVRPLAAMTEPVRLAPGRWRATLARCGLIDEVIGGQSDVLSAALALGEGKQPVSKKVSGTEVEALARKLPTVTLDFELKAGGAQQISASIALDRGKAPDLLEELRTQLLTKVPDGTMPAIVAAAVGGAFADLAAAVAVAAFVAAADALIEGSFGDVTALARTLALRGEPDGPTAATLCLTRLPPASSINVGEVPVEADFGLGADGRLVETRRGRSLLPESAHAGWVAGQRSWAVLELSLIP